jgi:4-oxalmesaconate hydratase
MLVIDCHGHYTTAPERHQTYRQNLLAAFKDPSLPAPEIQEFCDDEIRETIENG